jgi:hypothetical protein
VLPRRERLCAAEITRAAPEVQRLDRPESPLHARSRAAPARPGRGRAAPRSGSAGPCCRQSRRARPER